MNEFVSIKNWGEDERPREKLIKKGRSSLSNVELLAILISSGTNNNNSTYVLQGYNGIYGCPAPMSGSDFQTAKNSIASKGFDESRLILAKQIIGSNCLLCKQIKELMELMSFEETKLELAKFAWHHNLDKGNYYQLNDAFGFESSIEELNKYTQSH